MSLLWGRRPETRVITSADFNVGGSPDVLGAGVEGALRLAPLFSAVRLISDQFASTPLHAYRERQDGTRERMSSQPALLTVPRWGTMTTWKSQVISSLLLWGNAYGIATSLDSMNRPTQIQWVAPTTIHPDDQVNGRPIFYLDGREIPTDRMVHIPWIVMPGRSKGLSPVGYFKLLWETGQAAQLSSRDWYVNGAVPSVHFKNTERTLAAAQAAEMKDRYKAAVQGRDALVTGKDWDLNTIGLPADEARFIEGLKLTATQVAAIYGIPPEEIGGERGSSMQYSTLEMDDLRLSGRTMRPWYVRVEDALTMALPRPQYARFNADALVRSDLKTRMEAHEVAQRAGIETNLEGRHLEDKPPMTDAERAEWLQVWHPQGIPATVTREGKP